MLTCFIAILLVLLEYALLFGLITLGYWIFCSIFGWTFNLLVVVGIFCIGLFLRWVISAAKSDK